MAYFRKMTKSLLQKPQSAQSFHRTPLWYENETLFFWNMTLEWCIREKMIATLEFRRLSILPVLYTLDSYTICVIIQTRTKTIMFQRILFNTHSGNNYYHKSNRKGYCTPVGMQTRAICNKTRGIMYRIFHPTHRFLFKQVKKYGSNMLSHIYK